MKSPEKNDSFKMSALVSKVIRILEDNYKMNINTAEKLVYNHYSENYLPKWYFHSNTPSEIAGHIFIESQLLNANLEYLEHSSEDGKVLTYFVNVGRDFPGRLMKIYNENIEMGVFSLDSVKTASGIRIITIEKEGRPYFRLDSDELLLVEKIKEDLRQFSAKNKITACEQFISSLPPNYLAEEINSNQKPGRIFRHLKLFNATINGQSPQIFLEDTTLETGDEAVRLEKNENRISFGIKNSEDRFVSSIFQLFADRALNMSRTYIDTFSPHGSGDSVKIISSYFHSGLDLSPIAELARKIVYTEKSSLALQETRLEKKLEKILRTLSNSECSPESLNSTIAELKELAATNSNTDDSDEIEDFMLNSLTDFMTAAGFLGFDKEPEILRMLLGFDSFDEFFVAGNLNGIKKNSPGFRTKHNCSRGIAFKGGLRIDPIVKFTEVAALAFMMTWKCARSKILFGGGKGGLTLNPGDFDESRIDFYDTLTNFGRSLFLVTGPSMDVPAGDVGCGGLEIGYMFEGFKSALRDLAMMAYGLKDKVAIIGNRIISLREAREILKNNFGINYNRPEILRELCGSEKYLELVNAAQITGKPRMGINVRAGATGKGLCFAILAAVSRLYTVGKWEPSEKLSEKEKKALTAVTRVTEKTVLSLGGENIISQEDWELLDKIVYVKLLKGKKVVVQGSGKVGGSVMKELEPYGVNIIAVSDAGGAVIGNYLKPASLLDAVKNSSSHPDRKKRNSVINADENVTKIINGAKEGAAILELECDILIPAALENAVTARNAGRINAVIEACGSNGTNTSKAEIILNRRGVLVIYDFLANQGGVNASYFEWLRNLSDRFKYESVSISGTDFDINVMDSYIMPEYRERIKRILSAEESPESTVQWGLIIRDIMFSAVNEDYDFSLKHGISMKTAGFINTQLRVLSAVLSAMDEKQKQNFIGKMSPLASSLINEFFNHPETELFKHDSRQPY